MPKRDDLQTILIIGSGPIVIGQGCEFDYSGTQACKALREEGCRVVLINSNPATIMTDPATADRTYIEPITPETVEKILIAEAAAGFPIDALLPTLGGQTALNCACALYDNGVLEKHDVEMIGADRQAIHRAEDRLAFRNVVEAIGLKCPRSGVATTMEEAWAVLERTGLPSIIRPAFTLGGSGGGIAYNREEFKDICRRGLDASMNSQILIDQSLIGWKEYELEVMRDHDDNVVIVCTIENIDPMGVHTGDSITVAPAQTLTDKEYQHLRDASLAIMRAIGVETGGSNVQFAINPNPNHADGSDAIDMVVIEMNPRVSRSSALASKATGFPIAKIAAKLALGYTLPELPNDITGETVACFEPTIDYVVTKMPRWTFEKFPEADETLTTQMKSVGEAMSIGRNFKESWQKAIRSMEVKRFGFGLDANDKYLQAKRGIELPDGNVVAWPIPDETLRRKLSIPCQGRPYYVRYALKMGWSVDQVFELTNIDPWFLDQFKELVDFESELEACPSLAEVSAELMHKAKRWGYSDPQLANLYLGAVTTSNIMLVRRHRESLGIKPVYKLVDTCAAEFEARTPYYYSAYEAPYRMVSPKSGQVAESPSGQVKSKECGSEDPSSHLATRPLDHSTTSSHYDDEIRITETPKVIILGGGPNRIGQGIEFDYCCVQAAFAARELGFEAVMVNSNPETVSTDYDTSDLLFFEPLTLEDTLNLIERLNGRPLNDSSGEAGGLVHGVIVQFGGQTPLNLAEGLLAAGVPIIGTSVDSIDLAEDRERFADLCESLDIQQPENGIARNAEEAVKIANRIGYPVLVRPSFVLGGRAMETVFDDEQLRRYMVDALGASDLADQPILVDRFLFQAIELDVDVVADFVSDSAGEVEGRAVVAGVMEHIEEAGIHSGDSACALPPHSLPPEVLDEIKDKSRRLARALKVNGLMNVQWAVRGAGNGSGSGKHEIYVIEVNPRASRTVPFVSKANGVPWARVAAKVMMGQTLEALGVTQEVVPAHTSIKEVVFPFGKFPGVDVILGPEMRSTGEVMGIDHSFPIAFAKAELAAGLNLPLKGKVFLSVRASDKDAAVDIARGLTDMGFEILTTGGTHTHLAENGVPSQRLAKIAEGIRPNALDLIADQAIDLIINTPTRKGAGTDEGKLRAAAVRHSIPMITTTTAGVAAVQAIAALREGDWSVRALQDYEAAVPV